MSALGIAAEDITFVERLKENVIGLV